MLRGLFRLAAFLALAFSCGACSPLRVLNGVVPDDASRVSQDIAYGEDARQRLDIYAPPGAKGAPVVVFFYGGSWNSGSRADYKFVGDALSSRGIVAVLADYRVYPQVSYPDFLVDSARAVAWTLSHVAAYGGDPRRVFVAGHSAGAYNAAMVALDERWLARFQASPAQLAGWIGLSGPYNFLPIRDEAVKPVFHFPATPPDSQPVNHVTRAAPPALLLAGGDDKVVYPDVNTDELAAALRRAGVPLREHIYPGKGHAILVGALARPLRWTLPVLDEMDDFIRDTPARPSAPRP